ncbi:hypothetical protein FA13DRAFT_1798362 [Coprinellus micaceus]|uniref:Uncharacterized protein n=1 Tax=Coprinellus micaceus TaxID=71717 RepID=A0A4Y7SNA3_COPMI|nr:hypothetical protein FA13DRAFT_1798362 [Coprinellus micaceus]
MHLNLLAVVAGILASSMIGVEAKEGDVLSATKVFQTIVKESPYLVTQTTVVTWTQSASLTEEVKPTLIPETVETGSVDARR